MAGRKLLFLVGIAGALVLLAAIFILRGHREPVFRTSDSRLTQSQSTAPLESAKEEQKKEISPVPQPTVDELESRVYDRFRGPDFGTLSFDQMLSLLSDTISLAEKKGMLRAHREGTSWFGLIIQIIPHLGNLCTSDPAARERLYALLVNPPPELRSSLVWVLGIVHAKTEDERSRALLWSFVRKPQEDPETAAVAFEWLNSGPQTGSMVAWPVEWKPKDAQLRALAIDFLQYPDRRIRRAALTSLAKDWSDADSRDLLRQLLERSVTEGNEDARIIVGHAQFAPSRDDSSWTDAYVNVALNHPEEAVRKIALDRLTMGLKSDRTALQVVSGYLESDFQAEEKANVLRFLSHRTWKSENAKSEMYQLLKNMMLDGSDSRLQQAAAEQILLVGLRDGSFQALSQTDFSAFVTSLPIESVLRKHLEEFQRAPKDLWGGIDIGPQRRDK